MGNVCPGLPSSCVVFLQFQRGGRTFPTFPTFPIPLTDFGFFGGTCRGRLTIRDTTFPGWCGVNELPLLRRMAHARGIDPQGQRANMKDAVAHPSQRFAEPRSLGTIAALAKRNRPAPFVD